MKQCSTIQHMRLMCFSNDTFYLHTKVISLKTALGEILFSKSNRQRELGELGGKFLKNELVGRGNVY